MYVHTLFYNLQFGKIKNDDMTFRSNYVWSMTIGGLYTVQPSVPALLGMAYLRNIRNYSIVLKRTEPSIFNHGH
jgi:hypothetical protein